MKILFTGGGTGGHFYPIVAVAEAIHDIVRERKLIEPQLYLAAPDPYDKQALQQNDIAFVHTAAGKMRRYFSLRNFFDLFKTAWGVTVSVFRIFFLYPDVIFAKGGYASFPTLLAARLFRIPVVIHESDTVPGRVSAWAGRFAARVAVSYPQAAAHFPADRVAVTGNPIRKAVLIPAKEGAHEFLKLEQSTPVILVLGGSQGAQVLNDAIVSVLPQLVEKYQVIHQTGEAHLKEASATAGVVLRGSAFANRYRPYAYLNDLAMKMGVGASSLVISRAGSTVFEIAAWGLPSILVPIPDSVVRDQTTNAFAYARSGAASVIEQNNLTPTVLLAEIERILGDAALRQSMSAAARGFATPDAARIIAEGILEIGLSHEA